MTNCRQGISRSVMGTADGRMWGDELLKETELVWGLAAWLLHRSMHRRGSKNLEDVHDKLPVEQFEPRGKYFAIVLTSRS